METTNTTYAPGNLLGGYRHNLGLGDGTVGTALQVGIKLVDVVHHGGVFFSATSRGLNVG